ncbi:hypothetical protein BDQ17DRAFT_1328831 [Cyathus striatus]|nr:hypothetical protein BDQ17DRAFT_1328831 [Cyathus striatus]
MTSLGNITPIFTDNAEQNILYAHDLEVTYIWMSRWNMIKMLYIFVRYFTYIDVILNLATGFMPFSDFTCKTIYQAIIWFMMIGISASDLTLFQDLLSPLMPATKLFADNFDSQAGRQVKYDKHCNQRRNRILHLPNLDNADESSGYIVGASTLFYVSNAGNNLHSHTVAEIRMVLDIGSNNTIDKGIFKKVPVAGELSRIIRLNYVAWDQFNKKAVHRLNSYKRKCFLQMRRLMVQNHGSEVQAEQITLYYLLELNYRSAG